MRLPAYLTENPRFFGGKKWVFWSIALLPAMAMLLLLSDPCRKDGNWPTPILLTIMVIACWWEAHVQTIRVRMEQPGPNMLWHVGKRAFRTLLSVTFAGLLPFMGLAILLPSHACYTDRARVYNAISINTSELKGEIERRASITQTLTGTGLGLTLPPRQDTFTAPSNGFVLENGTIVLVVEEPPAAVLFTPKLVNPNTGAIEWSCRGYPAKLVPSQCREPR